MNAAAALTEIQSTLDRIAREQGPAVVGVGRGWRVGTGVWHEPADHVLGVGWRRYEAEGDTLSEGAQAGALNGCSE